MLCLPIRWRKKMMERLKQFPQEMVSLEEVTLKDNKMVREVFNR